MESETSAILDRYFHKREEDELFSGVVRISNDDSVLYTKAFGYANRAWEIPNQVDFRFDTASVTKLFTAVAILQLIDQQHFNLDTSVVDYLNLEGTAISPSVNVFHLLTHTSGIADDCEEEDNEDYEQSWLSEPCYVVTETNHFLHRFAHKEPNFEPGAGCRYCNCSFILLGLMIEQASGMKYRDYIRQNVFHAIGMNDSDFLHLGYVSERMAEGYDRIVCQSTQQVTYKKSIFAFPPIGSPDSGAYVTAYDLELFLRAVMQGRLLSPDMTRLFFEPQVFYRRNDTWEYRHGIVWLFYIDSAGEVVCFQKEGYNAGVSAVIRYYPAHSIYATILSNMAEGAWEPVQEVHRMVCGGYFSS